jgi:hypothetical protein
MYKLGISCAGCGLKYSIFSDVSGFEKYPCPKCGNESITIAKISGYIYILSNAAMPGLVKIGFTGRTVAERVAELGAHTGVAIPYVVEAAFPVVEPAVCERLIHSSLSSCRLREGREFFRISPAEAIIVIRRILGIPEIVQDSSSLHTSRDHNPLGPIPGNNPRGSMPIMNP